MADSTPDHAPEQETHPEPESAPVPEPTPDPQEVAEDKGEKVPAWGQALIERVDNVLDTIVPPPGTPDASPKREPWHKRSLRGA